MEHISSAPVYQTETLNHLGLVSGVFQDLGLLDLIDTHLESDPRSVMTHGQTILAMVINGLGFTSRPMYLSPQFFQRKPVDLLVGEGLSAEDITEYQYGKTLDALYAYGTSRLFAELGSQIFLQEGLGMRVGHYDTTSVSVHGSGYGSTDPSALSLTFGYSKDHRSDLRQFLVGLMVEPQYGIPWLFEALDGNVSDKKHFAQVIQRLQKEAKESEHQMLLIADSALFTEEGLKELNKVHYITRVPHTFQAAKEMLGKYSKEEMTSSSTEGYAYIELNQTMFDQQMRWLVVYSAAAYERESKKLEEKILGQENKLKEELRKLGRKDFGCQEDARKAVEKLIKKRQYLQLDQIQFSSKNKASKVGRPKKGQVLKQVWRVKATAKRHTENIEQKRKQIGKFILATNQLDQQQLPQEAILTHYKNQYQVEKGFRFLKSPMCLADALFLKKPERIEALAMIMCLALMVYALGERKLRETLKEIDEYIPNQKGKPTQRPTLRWVFQTFEDITILKIQQPGQPTIRQVLNLNVVHHQVIAIFGGTTEKIYTLAFSP